ncbi:MAG: D-2-hydroxyacid dehydrogenase [Proteobacteria bacterium]|nr:D-2-hydroxyacid dehydrogenase [Pseudomonadota bacterium]
MKLLVFEPAFNRIRDRLPKTAPPIEAVLIHQDGSISLNGNPVSMEDAVFDIAWASSDLFMQGPARVMFKLLTSAKQLKWFQSGAAGMDHPIFKQVADTGTLMTRSDAQGISIAEFVLARVLEVFSRAGERRQAQIDKEWARYFFRDVFGTTWLIIGYGAIGRETGKRAKAFGANVIGVRRNPSADDHADEMITPDKVLKNLPRADVVVVSVPHTDETNAFINEDFLDAMKEDSVFVNVGRGKLVDEAAMLRALDAGKIAAAVLDVFETEPLPVDSPFWDHPRVLLTAHCAAESPMNQSRGDDVFVTNLEHYIKGEPMRLVVSDFG